MKKISSVEQHNRMVGTSVPKLLISMSIPMVASQLITVIYNTADTWFVSQLGTSASAAVGVVFSIMAIIQAFGFGISMGTGSLVSVKLGEKKDEEAGIYAVSGLLASVLLGVLVGTVGLIFTTPLMRILGSTDTMLPYAVSYAKYVFAGAPIMCASFALSSVIRSEGQAVLAMVCMCSGGLVNMLLDPVFIFLLKMDTGGAALATVLSQTFSFLLLLSIFIRGRSIIRLRRKSIAKSGEVYLKIVTTGIPTICRQSFGSIASALLNRRAVIYGDAAVAAITIATKVYILVRNVILGVGQGLMPIAGYNFGAGYKKRTGKAFWWACLFGTAVCVTASVLTFTFRSQIMEWFRDDPEVIEIGVQALKYFCMAMPLMAYSTYVNQLYQCLGFKVRATFLASCRQGIFFIPVLYISTSLLGITGIEITQSVADVLTCLISVPFQIWFFKKELKTDTY